ncbi:MAG: YggS family pyridoxal phosphate-dependent enzyme [Clostridia bacterium]|nr:YggS family pyridoxal phosphate-dependent enzyme [Clostridia bacterium]
MSELTYIEKNLQLVRQHMDVAERSVGREGQTRMLAAVKYGSPEEITALLEAGVTCVGENRVQQLLEHWPLLQERNVQVHFIGSLQTNKVKYIIDKVAMIHSVDSLKLATEIHKRATNAGRVMDILVEINGAREEAKSGVLPEEAGSLCRELLTLSGVRLCGFMTMGPRFESEEAYRTYFAGVRHIGEDIWQSLGLAGKPLFSMGMSESFAPAIQAGAHMVRVGRSLFRHDDENK